jgi:hypothetical protein
MDFLGYTYYGETVLGMILKFAPVVLTGIISTLIAVHIFKKGKKKDKEKDVEKLKDIREYMFVLLQSFQNGLEAQILEIKELIEINEKDLNNKKSKIATLRKLRINVASEPTTLIDISKNDVFKFFIIQRKSKKKERIQIFTSFYNRLSMIKSKHIEMYKDRNEYQLEVNMKVAEMDDEKGKMIKLVNSILITKDSVSKELISEIKTTAGNYTAKENIDIQTALNTLFIPLVELTKKGFRNPINTQIFESANKGIKCYHQLLHYKENRIIKYKEWLYDFQKMEAVVEEFIQMEFQDLLIDYKDEPVSEI